MGKIKITLPTIKALSNKVICIPYCNAHYLLSSRDASAYNSGVYGWNYDTYFLYDKTAGAVAICTGYRTPGGIHPDYELTSLYEKKAEEIRHNKSLEFIDMIDLLEDNLSDYIKAVLN